MTPLEQFEECQTDLVDYIHYLEQKAEKADALHQFIEQLMPNPFTLTLLGAEVQEHRGLTGPSKLLLAVFLGGDEADIIDETLKDIMRVRPSDEEFKEPYQETINGKN